MTLRRWLLSLSAFGFVGLSPLAAQTQAIQAEIDAQLRLLRGAAPLVASAPAVLSITEETAIRTLAAKIDKHLEKFWTDNNLKPSNPADDTDFLRRVSLDLVGRIPSVAEVRKFLADPDPKKRQKKVAELLRKPGHINHFSSVLRKDLAPQTIDNPQLQFAGVQFETWLKDQVKQNVAYDKMVREILTAPTLFNRGGVRPVQPQNPNSTAMGFNQANEFKPENAASSASRLFMGIKMECAQCHDHPFAEISREQFWQTAAFFAELQPAIANSNDVTLKREITIQDPDPKKQKKVAAKFFDGTEPKWAEGKSPREVFVDWLIAEKNPYFAKNAVNRMWSHFFGMGFIDPIDEPGENNPELVPELVEELAKSFRESGYDNRVMIQAITRTKAYQLSSRQTDSTQHNPRNFARMNVRALSAEQLFDSIAQATGYLDGNSGDPQRRNFAQGARREFMTKFASTERAIDRQTSILQALTLMNGKFVNEQTNVGKSNFLTAIADAPFMDAEGKVEALFIATLSRKPTREEQQKFSSYVQRGGVTGDEKAALADLFWALLNSSEFILNR